MRRKILVLSLTTSLLAQTARSEEAACATPLALDQAGCRCYAPAQLQSIADALSELKICRATLVEKEALIQERLVHAQSATPQSSWWQEPKAVIGGIALTLTLSSLLTLWVVKK